MLPATADESAKQSDVDNDSLLVMISEVRDAVSRCDGGMLQDAVEYCYALLTCIKGFTEAPCAVHGLGLDLQPPLHHERDPLAQTPIRQFLEEPSHQHGIAFVRPDVQEVLDWVTYLGIIEDDNEVTVELIIEEEVHVVEVSMEYREPTEVDDEGA